MLKLKLCLTGLVVLSFLGAQTPSADEITDAALGLCEKVKSCAMAQIEEEDLTPELRQMMRPMLDGMCANMQSKVEAVATGHPMYAPAIACMRSMEALSCEAMQDPGQMETPECAAYEKLVGETNDKLPS